MTLVELMVAIPLAIIVAGIPLGLLLLAIGGQDQTASRSVATRQAETGLEQLTRDLREASAATITSSANGLSATATLLTPVRTATPSLTSLPAAQQVVWQCTAGATCTRQVAGGVRVPRIQGVVTACFDVSPTNNCSTSVSASNPSYLYLNLQARVTSQLPNASGSAARGVTNAVTIRDGVDLRNFS
jgi:type II secretory pathway pseudopilin PulG